MADDALAEARYAKLTWNAPLSEQHADELLTHLSLGPDTSLVDLGCGWGELLLRAAWRGTGLATTAQPVTATFTGVDTDASALARGRRAAERRALKEHVSFVEQPADAWRETRDRAICIGSSHTLGGSRAMLERLAEVVPQGGRVLVGDMCWERTPTDAAHDMFGDEVPRLADFVDMCRETGWQVLHLSTCDQREWDDFESRHRAGLREWLLANPESPKAKEVKEQQDARERDYIGTYRGVLGFVYLVLAR
jgi:cyclopropane fatty-acyl-phospholipid synthase-like methyltransferase